MEISRIVVDKRLMTEFKRRAFRAYPKEHVEAILGKVGHTDNIDVLYVFAFDELEKDPEKTKKNTVIYDYPEEEIEAGSNLKYFGTLHTHPNTDLVPSPLDWKDFMANQDNEFLSGGKKRGVIHITMVDEIMGIMYLSKKMRQKFTGCAFFNRMGNQIEFIVAENLRKNDTK